MAKFGSGLFLLVQVVLLLDFVYGWNENWVAEDEQFWYMALLLYTLPHSLSRVFYFTGSLHLDKTRLNLFIIITLILVFAFVFYFTGSLHLDKTRLNVHHHHIDSRFCICYCHPAPKDQWNLVACIGYCIGYWSTVLPRPCSRHQTHRVGTSYCFPSARQMNKNIRRIDILLLFHLIFSLYSATIFTGWSTSDGESRKLVDVGWPSVRVRIAIQWATAGLFIWSLVAPILFPDREF
ncbi:hypothetical protein U9M48_032025 [Paspalum notatum var. saurae]|uniref:Uncharacterized protein n=1 Tax=Paspalum notatum var. saurae TaxID=547442 RepID=A0AAQ3X415_PASNO